MSDDERSALAIDVMAFLRERGVPAGEAWRAVEGAIFRPGVLASAEGLDLVGLWYEAAGVRLDRRPQPKTRAA